ncbi:MAG TPA: Smr/MutS family protein [Woeseiaceae bacterium]|nr:Smr/MutS family protein [Woeseiaceae bacterium]
MAGRQKPDPPRREATEDDASLFRKLMAEARPLKIDVVPPLRPQRKAIARSRRADERQVLADSLNFDLEHAEAENGDGLRFHRSSVGRKTMRRLARGGFSVQAATDLHGMTVAEARGNLRDFLDDARRRGYTCVRVVHGKGLGSGTRGPVLKRKVDHWLRQWDGVLAFVSARQVDGGTGALYVLLRKG